MDLRATQAGNCGDNTARCIEIVCAPQGFCSRAKPPRPAWRLSRAFSSTTHSSTCLTSRGDVSGGIWVHGPNTTSPPWSKPLQALDHKHGPEPSLVFLSSHENTRQYNTSTRPPARRRGQRPHWFLRHVVIGSHRWSFSWDGIGKRSQEESCGSMTACPKTTHGWTSNVVCWSGRRISLVRTLLLPPPPPLPELCLSSSLMHTAPCHGQRCSCDSGDSHTTVLHHDSKKDSFYSCMQSHKSLQRGARVLSPHICTPFLTRKFKHARESV